MTDHNSAGGPPCTCNMCMLHAIIKEAHRSDVPYEVVVRVLVDIASEVYDVTSDITVVPAPPGADLKAIH